jgi:hypothetical protein
MRILVLTLALAQGSALYVPAEPAENVTTTLSEQFAACGRRRAA